MEPALGSRAGSTRLPEHRFDFPRTLRVRRSVDYRRIQRRGRRVQRSDLLALFLPRPPGESRFGFTVSRKVGGAVVRNRVKRWLREAVRHERHCMTDGWDIVFIARRSAAQADAGKLRSQVRSLLLSIDRRRR